VPYVVIVRCSCILIDYLIFTLKKILVLELIAGEKELIRAYQSVRTKKLRMAVR
jgi:hypothetical protein